MSRKSIDVEHDEWMADQARHDDDTLTESFQDGDRAFEKVPFADQARYIDPAVGGTR